MAARLARDREERKDPTKWGVSAEILTLASAREDVDVVVDSQRRGRIVHAKRSDAFSLITMSPEQERAAKRYWRDWCHRAGVMTEDPHNLELVDRSPGLAPGQQLTQRMLDAGGRLDDAHAMIGRADVQLLRGLVEPLVMQGQLHVWRVVVQKLTGETERHAQAAKVRSAVENLRLAYDDVDEENDRLKRSGMDPRDVRRRKLAQRLGV